MPSPHSRVSQYGITARLDVVSCYLHHPFFSLFRLSSKPKNDCVVFNSKQNVAAFQVQQGHDLSCKPVRLYVVTLELQPRVLTIEKQFQELRSIHVSLSKPILQSSSLEGVLAPFKYLLNEFTHLTGINGTHVFRPDYRVSLVVCVARGGKSKD